MDRKNVTGTKLLTERSTDLQADESARTIRFIASDETVDRYGDVVSVKGWSLANYRQNPIFLWGHDYDEPIGRVMEVGVEDGRLMATARLADEGTSPFIDRLWKSIKQKFINAVSVGFMVHSEKDYEQILDEDEHFTGFHFLRQELLEISLVAVPANPSALLVGRSLNLPPDFLKRVLRTDASVLQVQQQYQRRLMKLALAGINASAPRSAS
jgi:HK97 family phage prohead protease